MTKESIEIWSLIKVHNDAYEISTFGNARSIDRVVVYKNGQKTRYKGKPLVTSTSTGYDVVRLGNTEHCYQKISRLVAKAFIPNPENKPEVNHIDGNKRNNHVENLEWNTISENRKHSHRILGKQILENHINAKLTNKQVLEIRKLLSQNLTLREIAAKYSVVISTIHTIKTGKTWVTLAA